MDEEQRRRMIRMVGLWLLHQEVPGAPAGALGPPSTWWETAEQVVDMVDPYFREIYR